MLTSRALVPILRFVALVALAIGCHRPPDREANYRALAERVAGSWRLVRDDDLWHGHPTCFATLDIEMDSPLTSTALVTFCGGQPAELSCRVSVDVGRGELEGSPRQVVSPRCKLAWEPSAAGTPREIHVQWSEAVSITGEDLGEPAFHAEDVLNVDFVGPWAPGEQASMLIYSRAATTAYNPR